MYAACGIVYGGIMLKRMEVNDMIAIRLFENRSSDEPPRANAIQLLIINRVSNIDEK